MHIKSLRSMRGSYGSLRRGQEANIPDHLAQQLVKRGLVVPVQGKGKSADTPILQPTTDDTPAGGQTGKAKQSSSSQADPVSKPKKSKKSKDAADS